MRKIQGQLQKATAEFAVKAAEKSCRTACALMLYQEKLPERLADKLSIIKSR